MRRARATRRGVQPVADEREAATGLGRDDHLEAVALEDRHCRLGDVRLVVVRGTAVEVDDGAVRGRRLRRIGRAVAPSQAPAKRPAVERRQRRAPVDTDDPVDEPAEPAIAERPVGDRRRQRPHSAGQVGLAEEPVAEPRTVSRPHRGAGPVVHLRDLHVGRAGDRAHAAAGAVVDAAVRWRCRPGRSRRGERPEPIPLRLRARRTLVPGRGRSRARPGRRCCRRCT